MPEASALAVRKSITVNVPSEKAFNVFTAGISIWWPRHTHSVSAERTASVTMEQRDGGRVYETDDDGGDHEWGIVTTWDPPRRVAFTWHPGYDDPSSHTDVEVTFVEANGATRVELVHTGWERLGERASDSAKDYDNGWDGVLAKYVDEANG